MEKQVFRLEEISTPSCFTYPFIPQGFRTARQSRFIARREGQAFPVYQSVMNQYAGKLSSMGMASLGQAHIGWVCSFHRRLSRRSSRQICSYSQKDHTFFSGGTEGRVGRVESLIACD